MRALEAAQRYVSRGWPVVPVAKGTKRPTTSWKHLQERVNTQDELQQFFGNNGVGISIVTGAISGLVVLDADSEHGKAELEKHLPENLETPICKTARGWHYYFRHPGGKVPSRPLIEGHLDVKADGGLVAAPPSEGKAWVIGPRDVDPAPLPENLLTLLHAQACSSSYNSYKGVLTTNPLPLSQGSRDHDLFTIAQYLRKGGASEAEAAQLIKMLGQSCNPPFPEKEALAKVISTYQHGEEAQKSLAEEVREWVLSTTDHFESTQVHAELGLSTRVHKKNVSEILRRMVAEGLIERGRKRGQFRVIDQSAETIDWRNVEAGEGLPLAWPLELEQRFEVMPGSVIVVSGESNAGKTAFLLDVARRNLNILPTVYFASSNEVSARTLRKRLELFNEPLSHWDSLETLKRAGDFQDVIRPDGLNLIDYLEVHADFYEIGGKLAAIAEKLKDGVAVVALQKNPGSNFGRGGAMTMDKATAYISLNMGDLSKGEPHTLKMLKTKYPLIDYANKPIRFKLAGGCRFIRS